MKRSRYKVALNILIFWTFFIGIGAAIGSLGMLIDPTGKAMGMDAMLPYFQKLPFADIVFQDLTFSGIALLIVNGVSNLTAAILLLKKKRIGVILGGIFGITLMLWICIQFYMFPPNFMSTIYFIFGFLQAVTGYAAYVFMRQEEFSVISSDYPNIGKDNKRLVVYFSRMGYTKKIALEEANKSGALICEIEAEERTDGTLGFWWCGRYAMHRWDMPIRPLSVELSEFDNVTICTPIWVFALSAPVRAFCRAACGKIKSVDYIIVHHTNGMYKNAAVEMDELLSIKHSSLRSVRCRLGIFKDIGKK